ncbi:PAS domain S-box protein [Candidatus Thiodictyon syntrophicum]|jgi:two-component system CheB/CheR fusion protein|uniref:histidine kinase n=1 Tax=Candidatus Thiodictyon syntrophicum TaxID=1166950 RepID=A0A2K8U8Y6_9GAMM|nr:PAS domain S-box protein [Candidatus Thiodictyon syntrophicum]AUB82017.1 hypothetical protein THSYN_14420 [Candidatus Thiodictyon syntrophicum]
MNQGRAQWVVGIGSSAGGLEAMRPLVRELRPAGLATYIVAQHFPRASADNLTEILGRDCPLRVKRIEDGEPLRPDQVFVTPPGRHVEVRDGRLRLLEPGADAGVVPSIDTLFESLAQGYGVHAVGVLLSGTGHDGTRGAEAIRRAGGRVLVQRPDSAAQGGMAQSALTAGLANDSLAPQDLAAWLNTIDEEPAGDQPAATALTEIDDQTLKELLTLVAAASQTDFSRYKEATLRRQVLRRMGALRLACPSDYLRFMRANPDEALVLRQHFMISVSAFFRDPGVFAALRGVLGALVAAARPPGPIRVWVPGCAGGEEAYSIAAILADLLGERLPQVGAQVFATDLDAQAIAAARAGVYPRTRLEGLDAGLCERFFVEGRDALRVSKTLRELCVFAEHDLLRHPPFTHMDLVSCRNVLIYFSAALQEELYAKFHYALNPGGLLLLGKAECGETVSRLFEPVDLESRIYRRRDLPTPPLAHRHWGGAASRFAEPSRPPAEVRTRDTEGTMHALLVQHYAPPSVLVNERLQALHFHGQVQRYLNLVQGQADLSVVALSLPALRSEVRTTAHLALLQGEGEVRGRPTPVTIDGQTVMVQVVVRRTEPRAAVLTLSFEEQPVPGVPAAEPNGTGPSIADELLLELQATRGHLHAIIGELESSNTDLQSLNEELQVSTEELQSTNEELQAGNEELSTLNDELQFKTNELASVNDLLDSIQNSIQLALVVVDEQFRVRRFNALAVRIFGLVPDDLGHSLAGIPCTLTLPRLRQQVETVVAGGSPLVQRVSQQGRDYLMQIAPHLDAAGQRIGAVLTFADISELTRAEAQRIEAEERFRLFMDHSPAIAWIKDADGRHIYLSRTFEQRFGVRLENWRGKTDAELGTASAADTLWRADREALAAGLPVEREDETLDPDGRVRIWHSISIPFCDAAGRSYVGGIGIDMTERKRAELALAASEARYRALVETSFDWMWEVDTQGVYTFASGQVEEILGYGPDEIIGRTPFDLMPPQEVARVREGFAGIAAQRGAFQRLENRNLRKDGREVIMESSGGPIYAPDGTWSGYRGFDRDVTALKAAREVLERSQRQLEELVAARTADLAASEDKLRLILESSGDGLIGLDARGAVTFTNPAAEAMLGYAAGALIGQDLHAAIHQFRADATPEPADLCPILAALRTGLPARVENDTFRRADGTDLAVAFSTHPMRRDAAIVGAVVVFSDATLRRQAEQAREQARAEAERLARIKSEFLANMSHEIRTPLNGVLGMAQVGYRASHADPKLHETFARILESGRLLLCVVNDILDFSRIEAGKLRIESVPIAPGAIADEVAATFQESARTKGIALHVVKSSALPTTCLGDPVRLSQILHNLLGNGIKFTHRGAVTLSAGHVGEKLLFTVDDTGIGMTEDQLTRLFTPFEQADASTVRNFGGTGLGLAITRRLVELMSGDIRVTSQPGQGTSVRVCLPGAATGDAPTVGAAAWTAPTGRPRLAGLRILVAEDNEINRLVLEQMLTAEGAQVGLAENGRGALEAVGADGVAWDAVLMDVQMPEMDGLEASRRILERAPELPIIGQTAHAMAEELDQCRAAGMVGQVSKPIAYEDLVATVLLHARHRGREPGAQADTDATHGDFGRSGAPGDSVDWAGLAERYQGRTAFVDRLAALAITNYSGMPASLRQWAAAGNLAEIGAAAHTLKSVAGNLRADATAALAESTQRAARTGNPDAALLALQLADSLDWFIGSLVAHRADPKRP